MERIQQQRRTILKRAVYIETTIISYLAARDSRDPVVYGRQILTREWWTLRRQEFDLVISDAIGEREPGRWEHLSLVSA